MPHLGKTAKAFEELRQQQQCEQSAQDAMPPMQTIEQHYQEQIEKLNYQVKELESEVLRLYRRLDGCNY